MNFFNYIRNAWSDKFTYSLLILYFSFLVFLPLIYSDEIIDPVLVSRQLFLSFFLFLVVLIVYFSIKNKKKLNISFVKRVPFVFFIFFCIFNITSVINAINKAEYYYVNSKYLIEGVFFYITILLLIQNKIRIHFLSKSIILFNIIVSAIAIYQIQSLDFTSFSYEALISIKSTSANKNLLSSILFLTFPFAFLGFQYSKSWKIISFIALVCSLFLIWIVQTRSVWVGTFIFIAGIVVFVTINFFKKNKSRYVFLRMPIITLMSFIILISLFTAATFYYKKKLTQINLESITSSSDGRVAIWKNSFEIIKDNFLFGVGSGNWQLHFPAYGLDKFADQYDDIKNGIENFQRPHNDYLWIFSESGLFGFLSYLIFIFSSIFYAVILFKNSDKIGEKLFYLYLFLGLSGYSIIAFFDFPLERIEHQIILLIIVSIILSQYYLSNNKKDLPLFVSPLKMIFVPVIIISFSLIISIYRYRGEYHTHRLYEYRAANNLNGIIEEANFAFSTFYNLDPMSTPILWYRGVAYYGKYDITQAIKDFNQCISFHPNHIHVLNNLATCTYKLGDHTLAQSLFLRALQISPDFWEARLNLSGLYFNDGKLNEAFETIDKCPTECTDSKYLPFLTAILNAKIDLIFDNFSDVYLSAKIINLKNNPDVLFKVYVNSKRRKESFDTFLKKNIL